MKRYLIQVRNKTSGDSSHRVYRIVINAIDLHHLCEILDSHDYSQDEVDILAVENMGYEK